MGVLERLITYSKMPTTSSDDSGKHPSSDKEFALANYIVNELKNIGLKDAFCDDNAYVYAHLDASKGCENKPKIGFIAHLDTAPDYNGENVNPQIIKNYDGKDITLGNTDKKILVKDFPELSKFVGRTLITTDGNSLLGADDKAGIAEIITMIEEIVKENIPHGKISICITPDEEIGEGALLFDLDKFGADFAYTIDGGEEGEVVYENFNAASCHVIVNGVNIHPGEAKDKMINASQVAIEFNDMLPVTERPEYTSGYEGFYLLTSMSGSVEKAELSYIIRDFEKDGLENRISKVKDTVDKINQKYKKEVIKAEIKHQYSNMKEKILPCIDIVEDANKATKMARIDPIHKPIRGGTDGAVLSYKGLPCPNLGTGGFAFHGPYEHITLEGMEKVKDILKNIVIINASK